MDLFSVKHYTHTCFYNYQILTFSRLINIYFCSSPHILMKYHMRLKTGKYFCPLSELTTWQVAGSWCVFEKTGKHAAISWLVSKKLQLRLAIISLHIVLSELHLNGFEWRISSLYLCSHTLRSMECAELSWSLIESALRMDLSSTSENMYPPVGLLGTTWKWSWNAPLKRC